MTASVTFSPRYASASDFNFWRIMALISGGLKCLPLASSTTMPSDLGSFVTSYGTSVLLRCTSGSSKRRPMKRLMLKMVFSGFVMACRLATWPTSRSPLLAKATTDGVMRPPSAFVMTWGSPPSMTATTEFVVPRSMPMILPIGSSVLLRVVRHSDEARPDDPVVQAVPALQLADHLVVGMVGGRLVDDRLVEVRIERMADRIDRPDPLALEDVPQLAFHQPHPLDPGVLRVGRHALESPVEVVKNAEQLADEDRVAELAHCGPLLVGAPLEVREVRRGALPVIEVLLRLRSDLGELALERLDPFGQLEPRRRLHRLGSLLGTGLRLRLRAAVGRVIGHCVSPYSLLISSFMSVDRYRTVGMARGYRIRVGPNTPSKPSAR